VAHSAIFSKVGSPAQTISDDSAAANAARCPGKSETLVMVSHRLTTSIGNPHLIREIPGCFPRNADSIRRAGYWRKSAVRRSPKSFTASGNVL
jgi:hypothetical protein